MTDSGNGGGVSGSRRGFSPGAERDLPRPARPVGVDGSLRVRIRYCECDPMGVAHHAAYVPWLEAGRTEILRDAGISYAQLETAGIFLVVTRLDVRYRRAGRYDDLLEIRTRVVGGGRVKIEHEYEVRVVERVGVDVSRLRETGEDHLAAAATTLACVDSEGRVRALPEWLSGG